MTELTTTIRPTSQTAAGPSAAPAQAPVVEEPTLITEHQVLFSTAAAVASPPAKSRRWTDTIQSAAGAVLSFFAGPQEPVRRHHPKRYSYLEDALMAREMYRL